MIPQFLTIGHITRDLHADGTFSLGGTVTFAAITAMRLGLSVAIVSRADSQLIAELHTHLPEISLAVHPSPMTTTFTNQYSQGFRTQYLNARADELRLADIPAEWLASPVVLFGPLVQEISLEILVHFHRQSGRLIAATPQGWLRRWESDGRVWPTSWTEAEKILPLLDVLILSHDDLLPFANGRRTEAEALLVQWSEKIPLLVATDGRHGATLYQHGIAENFPAYTASEIDPTGAGDVFAAAFLTALYQGQDARSSVDFANCVAALSIEHEGTAGIPTLEAVKQKLTEHHPIE